MKRKADNMGDSIESIRWYYFKIPLVKPYQLQYETLTHFDTCIVEVKTLGNRFGYGESTPLPGYSPTSIADTLEYVSNAAPTLVGQPINDALSATLNKTRRLDGFLHAALTIAIETASTFHVSNDSPIKLELVAGLELNTQDTKKQVEKLIALGHRTIKTKIGFDIEKDIAAIIQLSKQVGNRARIRIDANQGYQFDEALRFVEQTSKLANIALLEQPLPIRSWPEMKQLRSACQYPLMLDEDICCTGDLDQANQFEACDWIKLKLMKCGSFYETSNMIQHAQQLGFKIVLGNGVQTELTCLHESLLASQKLSPEVAGEMNGFTRHRPFLMSAPLQTENGTISIPPIPQPFRLNLDASFPTLVDCGMCN